MNRLYVRPSTVDRFLTGVCLIIALIGCKQNEVTPVTTSPVVSTLGLSGNALTFAASEWAFYVSSGSQGDPNQTQSVLITDGATSTAPTNPTLTNVYSYSLGITTTSIKDKDIFSYWTHTLTTPKGLSVGKSLTLKAKIQLQDVQGPGVSIALRGDRKGQQSAVLFATTQGKISVTGTNDFQEYSITLPYTTSVDYVDIYLILLNQTTGKVFFKDVSLQVG